MIANWSRLLLIVCCAWREKDAMVRLGKAQTRSSGVGASVAQFFLLGFLVGHWIVL